MQAPDAKDAYFRAAAEVVRLCNIGMPPTTRRAAEIIERHMQEHQRRVLAAIENGMNVAMVVR